MLDLNQIESFYPEYLRSFKRNLLREYLQYKILEVIFDSPFADSLCFMGGTATHIVYQNARFSEDLDFDNLGLTSKDFKELTDMISHSLSLEGYKIETAGYFKTAYSCGLKILDVLYSNGLSEYSQEKLLVKLDTEPQNFSYEPQKILINKFDVFLSILVVPIDILLAQKIYAIFKRKRTMGRDFYDAVFLLGRTKPNMAYIKTKLNINDGVKLKKELSLKCKSLNFKRLAKDVESFIYKPGDAKKVRLFPEYLRNLNFCGA